MRLGGRPRSWRGHLQICRFDHWVKNVFVLPGIALALILGDAPFDLLTIVVGLVLVGVVASSNYVLNELLDAPTDRHHPTKRLRPVPSGQVSVPLAYAQWLLLGAIGIGCGALLDGSFAIVLAALWIMGVIYNVPPLRSKDVPWLDVLSESINNPLRFLAGWYLVLDGKPPPLSLLLAYWMVGCFFMDLKRYSEYRGIADPVRAAAYRKSFRGYNEELLLIGAAFYSGIAMLFLGFFVARHRLELLLAFPALALLMTMYMRLAFHADSAVAAPELLWRQGKLMLAGGTTALLMLFLLMVDLPWLHTAFPGPR